MGSITGESVESLREENNNDIEKGNRLATGGPWHNMFSWSLLPILSAHLSILLVFPGPLCDKTSHGSCGWGSAGGVRRIYSVH